MKTDFASLIATSIRLGFVSLFWDCWDCGHAIRHILNCLKQQYRPSTSCDASENVFGGANVLADMIGLL